MIFSYLNWPNNEKQFYLQLIEIFITLFRWYTQITMG